jgi:hypothetical protein
MSAKGSRCINEIHPFPFFIYNWQRIRAEMKEGDFLLISDQKKVKFSQEL